jgi:hypothetical protein
MSVWTNLYYMPVVKITTTGVNANSGMPTIYADNDAHAAIKGVPLLGFYLASQENTMGVKYGTVLQRTYNPVT